jgi:oxalate decarboxylase
MTGGLGSSGGLAKLDTHRAHVFDLAATAAKDYDGGELRHGDENAFPILAGHDASAVLVRLTPGGIREPHWHPSAWEMHYVIAGSAHFSLVEPQGYHEQFDAAQGSLVFLPQGGLHYFENTSTTDDYVALLVFNTSAAEPRDDIGLVAALNVIPRDVLGAVFRAPTEVFTAIPQTTEPVTITRRR